MRVMKKAFPFVGFARRQARKCPALLLDVRDELFIRFRMAKDATASSDSSRLAQNYMHMALMYLWGIAVQAHDRSIRQNRFIEKVSPQERRRIVCGGCEWLGRGLRRRPEGNIRL